MPSDNSMTNEDRKKALIDAVMIAATAEGWYYVRSTPPPKDTYVLGYDLLYGNIGECLTCSWCGGQENPPLHFTDGQKDDCDVVFWRPMSDAPSKKLLSLVRKNERRIRDI